MSLFSTFFARSTLYNKNGDSMKFKHLFVAFLSCLICYLFYDYLFHEYQDLTIPVSEESKEVYFLQYGAYSNYDNMVKATSSLPNYIYTKDDKYHYAFICITESEKNALKVKDFYKEKGYVLYSKKINVTSSAFLISLTQFDLLLNETNELETIPTICSQGLEKYKEEVSHED